MEERNAMTFGPLVDAAWLAENLGRENIRVVDATWYLPIESKDARAEHAEAHIPDAVYVDISDLCDKDHAAPHMLPSPERFAASVGALGIGSDCRVVVHDNGEYAATRVWWMFRVFGHEAVALLDGGLASWRAAGGAVVSGDPAPTEAGAFGASLSFIVAFFQRRLTWRVIKESVNEAVTSTARIFFVAVGAVLLTKYLALTGVPVFLGRMIGDWALDPMLLVVATSLIYLALGMFLDPLGLLLITLPILLPMFEALHLDLIWFGVLVVKFLEIGLLTPPVGFNVYVIKSVVGDLVELETIFKGVLWFLACEVVVVVLLVAFPEISLWLPSTMD